MPIRIQKQDDDGTIFVATQPLNRQEADALSHTLTREYPPDHVVLLRYHTEKILD